MTYRELQPEPNPYDNPASPPDRPDKDDMRRNIERANEKDTKPCKHTHTCKRTAQ